MGSSGKRRRHSSKEDSRRRESTSPKHKEKERGRDGGSGGNKLTEEERCLYDKARAYVEQEDNKGRRKRRRERHRSDYSSEEEDDDRHNNKSSSRGRKKKNLDKYNSDHDSDDSDVSNRRDHKHHRSSSRRDRKKHHKRRSGRDRDDRHEKSSKKKSSKHRHHHTDDEEEERNKHSSKRHKRSKHQDVSFRQKATKHGNTSSKSLVSLGEIISAPPQQLLDTDTNYFSHNSHLRLYLFRHYGIYFEDLTSEESHDAFKEFVSKYNGGKLETAYYDKIPQEALDQCQRTQHKWNFKTNKVELQSLKIVRDGVKKQTEYDADNNGDKGGMMQQRTQVKAAAAAPGLKSVDQKSDEQDKKLPYYEIRRQDNRHRERIKVGNEEMFGTGKADHGRERMIEKKREQANRIHGAARDRENEAGAELDDKAIYGGEGGGDVSYEAALAREKKYRERKEAAKQERTSELLKKEEDKQKKMLEMLGFSGLKPGEKIKIAPRQP